MPSRPRRNRPPKHPAYRTKNYIAYSRQIKAAHQNGHPFPCSIAGAHCTKYATVAHHIVPVLQGGSWGNENLTPACRACNNALRETRKRKSFS